MSCHCTTGRVNLKEFIVEYEFGVVPRSLFSADGCLFLAYYKSPMLHYLEKMNENLHKSEEDINKASDCISPPSINLVMDDSAREVPQLQENQEESTSKNVCIVNGMALANYVINNDNMNTCAAFAESSLSIPCNMAEDFEEVRIVFDRFLGISLKTHIINERTQRKTT